MTTTSLGVREMERSLGFAEHAERGRRARQLSLWRDSLLGAAWLVTVAGVAFFFASGAMAWTAPVDAVNALGRFAGLVATALILFQMALASRAPWIERALGHDKALKIHGSFGEPIFYLLVAHAALLVVGQGSMASRGIVDQTAWYLAHSRDIAFSILSLALLLVVGVTSVAAVRRRWPYETWHAIHLFTYAAIALAVPHQFGVGSTFSSGTPAKVFWIALYVIATGSLVIWRMWMPLYRAARHRLRVMRVERHDDGTVSVTIGGRNLHYWNARAGQFFIWRFLTPELWATAHPYSLSSAPDGRSLRITVKPLGDDSLALRTLRPGVRVVAEGPLGRFHHDSRVGRGLVLIGAGVGITPLRAMLEDERAQRGECTVILRASTHLEAPLLDEIRQLAVSQGVTLYEVIGPRGRGWSTPDGPQSLSQIVPRLSTCDVFVCGPEQWSARVKADARHHGVPEEAIHAEEFAW
jgi:predicted ferric reductase